jgi:predicted enzyme related to lactoylglutathione lyase
MIGNAKYVHTNLIARDWRRLSSFYQHVFGCIPVPPQRRYSGEALEAGTNLSGASLEGEHLRLPGHGPHGPTLEIFQYHAVADALPTAVNRPGFGHIAFEVRNIEKARDAVLANGGEPIGAIVGLQTAAGATVTWCYVTDPEGNVIELQCWD